MAKKSTKKTQKGVSSSFVNVAGRKKQQKIVFIILTIVLGVGLVGSSMFWAFGGSNSITDNSAATETQPEVTAEEQIKNLEAMLKEDPKNTELMGRLAELYWQNGKARQAVDTYSRALEIKPGDVRLRKDLALTYYLMGEYDKAVSEIEEVLKQNSSDAQAHYYLGQFYAYRSDGGRDVDKGIKELEEFVRLQKEGIDVQKARQMIEELKSGKQ
jgi:cytochrome c-type biogenesis protein CcmH/NrfG